MIRLILRHAKIVPSAIPIRFPFSRIILTTRLYQIDDTSPLIFHFTSEQMKPKPPVSSERAERGGGRTVQLWQYFSVFGFRL